MFLSLDLFFFLHCRPKHAYLPPETHLNTFASSSSTSTTEKSFEYEYAQFNLTAPVIHNPSQKLEAVYSFATAPEEEEPIETNPLAMLFDDPIYSQPQKQKKASPPSKKGGSLRYHKQQKHTASTENLLEDDVEDSGEYDEVKEPQLPPRPAIPVIRIQHYEDKWGLHHR